jgi:hypothetical protein
MKQISEKKYDTLYDYLIASITLEKNFILFITSWINKDIFKKIYQLDNFIKGDIKKNIDLFIKNYPTFKKIPNPSSSTTTSTTSGTSYNLNSTFENYFNNKINI